MTQRIGVIDIGTNTTRLAIFETRAGGGFTPLVRRSEITRLGQGVNQERTLPPEAVARTLHTLDQYLAECREHALAHLAGVGTSVLRDAADAPGFVDTVRARGVDFKVVSGAAEAQLVFAGAATAFDNAADRAVLVVDSGGGSTELIRGRGVRYERVASIDVGAVRMTEQFLPQSPPAAHSLEAMEEFIATRFQTPAADFSPGPGGDIAAVGGTVTTLAALPLGGWDPERIHGLDLSADIISGLYRKLASLPAARIAELPGMEPKRADIITAGAGIYVCLLRAFRAPGLRVCLHDIRHGVLQAVLSGQWQNL